MTNYRFSKTIKPTSSNDTTTTTYILFICFFFDYDKMSIKKTKIHEAASSVSQHHQHNFSSYPISFDAVVILNNKCHRVWLWKSINHNIKSVFQLLIMSHGGRLQFNLKEKKAGPIGISPPSDTQHHSHFSSIIAMYSLLPISVLNDREKIPSRNSNDKCLNLFIFLYSLSMSLWLWLRFLEFNEVKIATDNSFDYSF